VSVSYLSQVPAGRSRDSSINGCAAGVNGFRSPHWRRLHLPGRGGSGAGNRRSQEGGSGVGWG